MERLGVRTEVNSKMDSVIAKDQRLSEGKVEAEDGKLDFEELSDDEVVTLHLPRKGADERDPPGVEIRDVPEVLIRIRIRIMYFQFHNNNKLYSAIYSNMLNKYII